MKDNENLADFAKTTQNFPSADNFFAVLKFRFSIAIIVSCSFAAGVATRHLADTRQFNAEQKQSAPLVQKSEQKPPPERNINLEREIDRRAEVKVDKTLRENLKGVLIVRDGEAQTIRFNQTAIGKKGEFTPIKNNVVYDVLNYFICLDEGYGFMSDEEKNLVLLIWRSGKNKPPAHINAIYSPGGRKIEIGKPY